MILLGDCRESLRTLPDQSVHCVVTSPPYFGLRDYGHDGQLGLEPTPAEFVAAMVEVFREVRRVLRDDGTLWLNLGDSWAGAKSKAVQTSLADYGCSGVATWAQAATRRAESMAVRPKVAGLNAKQLLGIPWRVAFALQDDGWILRDEIIWHKPGVMPYSGKDRFCRNHEQLFLFAKSPRYSFDYSAIREPAIYPAGTKGAKGSAARQAEKGVNARPPEYKVYDGMRTKRSVWTVSTKPFKEAHFATYPPDLIEPCILAGCPAGGTVLDPFFGAGTTGLVAERHGRKWIGCELNPEYAEIAERRIAAARPTPSVMQLLLLAAA
jgi:DNA modification methylase